MFPGVPSLSEAAGLPSIDESSTWIALAAPAGTPRPIVEKIQNAIAKIYADKPTRERLEKVGINPVNSTSDELDGFIRSESVRWAQVLKENAHLLEAGTITTLTQGVTHGHRRQCRKLFGRELFHRRPERSRHRLPVLEHGHRPRARSSRRSPAASGAARRVPTIIVCPHENTAAHMAGGYAMMTGRGQGVLVHVDVGTANTANAMHNLYRSRLPVLLMAGKAPFTTHGELTGTRDNYVHFVQEPFDQGSLVRPYTKWEWTLPSGIVAKEVIRRAHTIMQSDPKGPVYLMLPREILTEVWADDDVRSYPGERYGSTEPAGADPRLVDKLADALLASSYPILLASYAGRTPGASEAIVQARRVRRHPPVRSQHGQQFQP